MDPSQHSSHHHGDELEAKPLLGSTANTIEDAPPEYVNDGSCRSFVGRVTRGEDAFGLAYVESMALILWGILVAYIMITVPEYKKYQPQVDQVGLIVAIVSLIDLFLRLWTSVDNKAYSYSRLQFLCSFFTMIDVISLVPYIIRVSTGGDLHGVQFLRVLRLFSRFGSGQGSSEVGQALSGILKNSRALLFSTSYFLLAIWFMVAACYHIVELDNPKVEGRFDTFLGSMWYSLINLMGEYPINLDLSNWGKVVGTVTMVIAIGGVQGIPAGILTDGYQRYMTEVRMAGIGDEEETDETILLDASDIELLGADVSKDSESSLDQLYLFINAHTPGGTATETFVLTVVVVNVLVNMLDTVQEIKDVSWWPMFATTLEDFSMCVFTIEYVIRFVAVGAHKDYRGLGRFVWAFTSFFSIVDLATLVPWYIDLFVAGDAIFPTSFVRVLRLVILVRIFKTGKFVDGLSIIVTVIINKTPFLSSVMYGICIMWVIASVGMYYAERHSPDVKVAEHFATMPDSLWMTLLNFTGEYPVADYTTVGKLISTVVAFVAIAVFGVPVAILSDGMMEHFEQLEAKKQSLTPRGDPESEDETRVTNQAQRSRMGQLFLFMKGQDLGEGDVTLEDPWWEEWGVRFEFLILFLIMLNTICFIIQSDPALDVAGAHVFFKHLETFSVIVYTFEFFLRLLATFGDPTLRGAWFAPLYPLDYIFSVFGMVDIVAIAPWYIALFMPGMTRSLTILRTLRLVRLFRIERYLPAFALLHKVLTKRYYSLVASMYITGLCTIFFATLLHYTEKDSDQKEGGEQNSYRFRSVPSSLWYTFVHLTGDYPLYKYSVAGRFVNFVMIILAQGLMGIPLGIIVEGFQSEMNDKIEQANLKRLTTFGVPSEGETTIIVEPETEPDPEPEPEPDPDPYPLENLQNENEDGTRIQEGGILCCRPRKKPKTNLRSQPPMVLPPAPKRPVVLGPDPVEELRRQEHEENMRKQDAEAKAMASPTQHTVFKIMHESEHFWNFELFLIVGTLFGIIVRSDQSLGINSTLHLTADHIQWFAAGCFAILYIVRIYICPASPKFLGRGNKYSGTGWKEWKSFPRFCYMTDFTGIIDLLAWLPFMVVQIGFDDDTTRLAVAGYMAQILVVLIVDRKLPAFSLLDDVLGSERGSGRLLLCSAMLALILWVLFAALLYIEEKGVDSMDGAFDTMPKSMFITMIFIGGEWALVDLQVPFGQLTGFMLAMVGIGVCGIPVAIFFDGYTAIAEELAEAAEAEDTAGAVQSGTDSGDTIKESTPAEDNIYSKQ